MTSIHLCNFRDIQKNITTDRLITISKLPPFIEHNLAYTVIDEH